MNVLVALLIVSFIFSFGQHLTASDNVDELWNKKSKEDINTNQDLQATIITSTSGLLQYNKSKEHHIISTYETKTIHNEAFLAQSVFGISASNHTTKPTILSRTRYIVQDKTTSFIPNKHNIGKLILRLKRHISSLTDDPGGEYYKIQNHSFPNDILRGYKTADLENQEFNSCILNCTLSKQKSSNSISDDPEDINTQCKENCFAQVFNNCISKCTKITDSNSDIHVGPLDIGRLCKSNCSTKILNECISNCTLHKIKKLDNSIFKTNHSLSRVNDQNRSFKILHSSDCTVRKLQSENFMNISRNSGLDFDGLMFNCSSLSELCSSYNDLTLNATNCFCSKLLTSCSSSDYVGIVLSSIKGSFNLSDMFNSAPNLFVSNCTLHNVSQFNNENNNNNNTNSNCALNCSVQVVDDDCSSDTVMSDIDISCINVTLMNMDRNVNQLADVTIKHITNLLTRNYFHDKDLFLDLRMTNCSLEEMNDFTVNCIDQSGHNVLCNKTNSKNVSNSVLEIGDSYTQKSLLAEQALILSTESSGYSSPLTEKPMLLSDTSQQEPNVSISDPEKNGSTSLCQDDCPGEELPQGDEPIDGEPSVADLEALCQPCHQVCHYRQNAPVRCGCYHGFAITSNWLHCIDVDECSLHPQLCHGGWCLNVIGSFVCHCPPGYQLVGHTCIDLDECQAHVCDQVCINVPGSYQCWCRSGFQPSFPGSRSCADVDECQHPVCSHACINTVGSFFCHCPSGWRLQSDDRTCLPSDLSNGIIESAKRVIILKDSKNPHEETSITFTKSSSKSGRRMVVLNSDKEIPNNPVLKNAGYSSFRAIPGKMERNSGERQEKLLKLNAGGSTGRNILTREVKFDCDRHSTSCSTQRYKPCVPSCKNGGVCNGKGVCHCTAGFQGRYCQLDRNECSEKPSPCSYMCINSFGGYQCVCPSGQVLADDGKSCVGATTRSAKTLSVLIEVVVEPSPTATLAPTYTFPGHTVFNTGVGAFLPHKGLTVENLVTEVVNKSGVTVPDKSSLPITSEVVREESNSTSEKIQPTKVSETVVSSDLVLVRLLEDNSTSSATSSQVNFTLLSTVFEPSSEFSELTASFDGLVTEAEPVDIKKQGNLTGDVLNITVPRTLEELKTSLPTIDGTGNLITSSDNVIITKSDDGLLNLIMPSSSVLNVSASVLSPTDIIFSHTPVLPLPTTSETLSNLTVVLRTSQVLMPDSKDTDTSESLFVTLTEDDSDGKILKEVNVKSDQLSGKVTKPRKIKQKEDKVKGGKEKDKLKLKKKHKTKIKVVKLTKDFQILNLSSIQEEVKNPRLGNDLKSVAGMKETDSGARYFEVIDYDDDSFAPVKYNSSDPFNFVPPTVVPAPLPTHATRPHLNEKDCYYGSSRIKSRTSFYRDNNNCTKCVCKDGELRCAPRHCPPLHCEVPLHGDCCDYCPSDCVVDRDVYLTGERFSPALDPCRECRCKSGRAVCDDIECQALECPEQFRYLLPGECCPVCKPPEPGCFSRGRFFYQGQLWVRQEGGCHACLCKDGEIQCNPVVCVVNCQHPQFIPGECCPLCEGCQHYNQKYSDQQMFPHPTDPCSICQCQNGNISCYHKPCSAECSHPYQPPGECCPQCVDCNFSGQRLRNASSIAVNLNGTCQECSCVLGNVSCAPSPCTASCVVEGKELPSGTEFNLGSDACTHCRCTNGVVSCQAVECASTCSHGVLLPDTCCLDCSKCDYQGRLFSEMEVFRPLDETCKSCLCVKGNVICQDTCSLSPLD